MLLLALDAATSDSPVTGLLSYGATMMALGALTQSLTLSTGNELMFGNPLLEGFKLKLSVKTGEFSGSLLMEER